VPDPKPATAKPDRPRSLLADLGTVAVLIVLLLAIYLLPPDTSLADIRQAGSLRVCVPAAYPPLVTGDPANPGFDVELLQKLAKAIGVRLDLNVNSAMGRDFNPRNWRVTRTQCAVLAGGVVDSNLTRSFLDVSPPYLETGWAVVGKTQDASIENATIGFYPGLTGLDRVALSRQLKLSKTSAKLLPGLDQLAAAIDSGAVSAGITEALSASQMAFSHNWSSRLLPPPLEQYPVVFGLWRGDLTLKRELVSQLAHLKADGELAALAEKYHVAGELK
jgi:ABC-type amino acid transport substrate-binding protein